MAGMVHFFHLTPEQFWNLHPREVAALDRFHDQWVQAQNKK